MTIVARRKFRRRLANAAEQRLGTRSVFAFPLRWLAFGISVIGLASLAGCPRQHVSPGNQSQQAALRRVDRSEALLKAAASQLNDLPSGVDTRLRPPVVILDATKSADGKDVMAVAAPNPSARGGPINVILVPANNARFRANGVKSGDVLKYYVLPDETVDEASRESGFTRRLAMELTVAQVIDDQTLLTEESLNAAVPVPERIEIWRYVDDRLVEINRQLRMYRDRRLPPLGWEPSPDSKALTQIVVWLNQWLRQSDPQAEWRVDPLLQTLSPELLTDPELTPHLSDEALRAAAFQPHEGRLLQEAVWHRDIARWARGDSFNNIERAAALFDWTVRNVQLVADEDARPHRPWQVLLYGRGSAEQRAWVFALLCRQLGLDVVMLTIPATEDGGATATEPAETRFWLPALVEGGQLYLFDARLGLAVPGAGGQGVATLDEVQQDDAILRQLDAMDQPYRVTADEARRVMARIVADPFDLTRRARLLERKLSGDDRLALSSEPSAVADELQKSMPQLHSVGLWEYPFRTLRDQLTLGPASARNLEVLAFEPFALHPLLWKARLRHFQGRRQMSDDTDEERSDETLDDHAEAARLYTSSEVRPAQRVIEREPSREQQRVDTAAKTNAAYWLGLLSFDDGRYEVAAHWFNRPELQADSSQWSAGAGYNLARAYEAQGKFQEAADVLEKVESVQQHGNKLRARQLESLPQKPSE